MNMKFEPNELLGKMKINCKDCCGLCCTALYFAKSEGFPHDKPAGIPCSHLCADYQCDIHGQLFLRKMKGCMAYDCFGAGQWVTQQLFKGNNLTAVNKEFMFTVFIKVVQLHQMLWYLCEAAISIKDINVLDQINHQIQQLINILAEPVKEVAACDVDAIRHHVNQCLKQVCNIISTAYCTRHIKGHDAIGKKFNRADLSGHDYSMCLLMAADFKGCTLDQTNFLGADLRDADLRNTDLSHSCFLTQGQINSAKGNPATKLPIYLNMPDSWLRSE